MSGCLLAGIFDHAHEAGLLAFNRGSGFIGDMVWFARLDRERSDPEDVLVGGPAADC
jgi:hypothetical protein